MDLSELDRFEQPKVGIPPLSEAIRIGARMSGPARGVLVDDYGNTCAHGAALLAMGMLDRSLKSYGHYELLNALWPEVGKLFLESQIMNDTGTHTREQIADWFEARGL